MKIQIILIASLICSFSPWAFGATFSIENVYVHDHVEGMQEGITKEDNTSVLNPKPQIFIPQIEVQIKVSQNAPTKELIAKAYYFDSSGLIIKTYVRPSPAQRHISGGLRVTTQKAIWPAVLPHDQIYSIYFSLPAALPSGWSFVVVFGGSKGAVAASVPTDEEQSLSYPEHDLVAATLLSPDVKIDAGKKKTSLIQEVVRSDNPSYPSFTLLMHLPHGVKSPHEVSGVLATCVVADSVGQIRDRLNAIKSQGDSNPYYAYAEEHNLAIIAWGARWVWSSYANFDQLDHNQIRNWDDNFQQLADAWNRGIGLLVDRYKIPDHDYLLYGSSMGGEWVHRLALHNPDRFLAVQMHISTSYDAPTPEANHVLWLLTTGELDSGCDNARRFYSAARKLNYPIIFKAVIGLGHSDSPLAEKLGLRFFDYALAVKTKRDSMVTNSFSQSNGIAPVQPLDLSGFNQAPFYGDLMNQEMFPARKMAMIPSGFLVPLPTKDIAQSWLK